MNSIEKQVAENIKRLRKVRNYSLDQLSSMTGVSKGMLAQIEKGSSSPTITTLWKIANGLQVSFTSLAEKPAGSRRSSESMRKRPFWPEKKNTRHFRIFPSTRKRSLKSFILNLRLAVYTNQSLTTEELKSMCSSLEERSR